MASAYYKVTAYVGTPHRNAVEVTLPLVGPAGPAGPAGTGLETLTDPGDTLYQGASTGERLPIGSSGQVLKVVGGFPAWAAESGATTVLYFEVSSTNSASPDTLNLTSTITNGNISAVVIVQPAAETSFAQVFLPELATEAFGEVIIRRVLFEGESYVSSLKVTLTDQGQTAIYPSSGGYDELEAVENYLFRWNGARWVMELRAAGNTTVNHEILLPDHAGILPAWRQYLTGPATPTSPGARGQLAFGYDDGQERLYICVATDTWRRVPISTWTPAP
jgi:hypothetical protein